MKRLILVFTVMLGLMVSAQLFVWHTDINQVAITWNRFSGTMELDDSHSFRWDWPWVAVSKIDTRPMRLCITSVARAYNCRLMQFEPTQWREFVRIQGFHYYWLSNRLSFNWGYEEEYRGVRDVMRGFAFSGKSYPFLKLLAEYPQH